MDCIFLLDKPSNKTSSQLILEMKKKYNFKKVGHAGTLDPLATGLLVVLVNKATKLSNYLLSANKTYQVTMQLFIETDSGDITGHLNKSQPFHILKKQDINAAFAYFNGFIYEQYPPIYSAIKYKGKKLYEYARNKVDIKVNPRKVCINKIFAVNYDSKKGLISFSVSCSKGTYIRSLVKDIAAKLNTIATVKTLRRIQSGEFLLRDANSLDKLNLDMDAISMYDSLLINKLPMITHHDESAIKHGQSITLINHSQPFIFIVNKDKKLLAIYKHLGKHIYACARGI